MNRLVSLLICAGTLLFVSCSLSPLGSDSGLSGSDVGHNSGTGGGVSFNRPDNLIGDQPSEDSYVRVVVELKSVEEGGPTYNYANTINLKALSSVDIPDIEDGVYDVYAWADSFSSDKDKVPFYNVENLRDISFEAGGYGSFGLGYRTAYYVSQKNVTIDGGALNLDMQLPHGGYEIIMTNPYEKMSAEEKYEVTISYKNYLPSGFNIYNQNVINSVVGVSYSMNLPEVTSQMTELCVGKDIVFCGSRESSVVVDVTICDDEGNVCYQSDPLQVPLERGLVKKVTLM